MSTVSDLFWEEPLSYLRAIQLFQNRYFIFHISKKIKICCNNVSWILRLQWDMSLPFLAFSSSHSVNTTLDVIAPRSPAKHPTSLGEHWEHPLTILPSSSCPWAPKERDTWEAHLGAQRSKIVQNVILRHGLSSPRVVSSLCISTSNGTSALRNSLLVRHVACWAAELCLSWK